MQGHFEKDIAIQKPPEQVYNLINHPQQIVGLQPLIASVEIKNETTNHQGQQIYDFVSFENVKFMGFIPVQNRIETHMILANPPYEFQQTGKTGAGITLTQTVLLEALDDYTKVTNCIDYDAPWYIFPYVQFEINNAHTKWLEILKSRAESN